MCDFCDSLIDNTKSIIWQVRSTYADDNINEFLDSYEEVCLFKLNSHLYKDNVYVGVEFKQEILTNRDDVEKIIISPFSEAIQFNFCPICGMQISKDIKDFGRYYEHQIYIEDNK